MKKHLKLFAAMALIFGALAVVSCGDDNKKDEPQDVKVTGVELKASTSITQGETEKLVATVRPDDATNKNVTFRSNDETIATVAADGTVTAVKEGSAAITVKTEDGGFEATCQVTVTPADITTPNYVKVEIDGQVNSALKIFNPRCDASRTSFVMYICADDTYTKLKPNVTPSDLTLPIIYVQGYTTVGNQEISLDSTDSRTLVWFYKNGGFSSNGQNTLYPDFIAPSGSIITITKFDGINKKISGNFTISVKDYIYMLDKQVDPGTLTPEKPAIPVKCTFANVKLEY